MVWGSAGMESNLTFGGLATLFGTMMFLAALPGVTVVLVTTRSAALGFLHGVVTTLGLVAGDTLFILMAVFGLAALGSLWEPVLTILAFVSGFYLVFLGVVLWRSPPHMGCPETQVGTSLWSSFLAGLLITLGDQKAILFYLGLLPAVADITRLTRLDVVLLVGCAAVALLGVKLAYAWLGSSAASLVAGRGGVLLGRITAILMVGVGGTVLVSRIFPMVFG